MNKYYNTFVYLDRNMINLKTVFNLDNDVQVGFDQEFSPWTENTKEFQDKINNLITYFGETIRHNMVVLPLPLPPELCLNKLFLKHIENMAEELIEMVDTNEITNSQLGEILAIMKVVNDDLSI